MDLNIVTTQATQPDGDLMASVRSFVRLPAPPRVLVGERAYERLIAAGARPEWLTRVPFVSEKTAAVLDVDRIERECERLLAESLVGTL